MIRSERCTAVHFVDIGGIADKSPFKLSFRD